MAKGKSGPRTTREQRTRRTYQILFIVISIIVLLTMVLSLTVR